MTPALWFAGSVLAPILVWVLVSAVKWVIRALARQIVVEINGALGLQEIRDDIATLKTNGSNLQQQLEALLTDR